MAARLVRALTVSLGLLAGAAAASAQSIEVAPATGYRFGGDFFEVVTGRPVDLDGALSLGVALNVPLSNGLQFEGLFTHQHARVFVPGGPFLPATQTHVSVDHWQGGGLQELSGGRVRPFLTGSLGLTRFGAANDSEIRFTVGGGGGVKVFATRHVGLRLDGRLFATFLDADVRAGICSSGGCILSFHADVVWQADFTAGVVFRLPPINGR
jgi:hypothetical protein